MSVVRSRVRDSRKSITSLTAAHQAIKARETLQTARAILIESDRWDEAAMLGPVIGEFTIGIHAWYWHNGQGGQAPQ